MDDREHRATWPVLFLRAAAGAWIRRLVVAALGVVVGSATVLAEAVAPGIPTLLTGIAVIALFAVMVGCLVAITLRWRTSLRSDGRSLVVRGPFGASVIPLHDQLRFGRWLEPRRRRPVLWLVNGDEPLVPISARLTPLRVEAFAGRLGLKLRDHDGPPPHPDDDDRFRDPPGIVAR